MKNKIKMPPKWLIYAIVSLLLWGAFGFLGKVGADRLSPSEMQFFFTIGVVPVALLCAYRLKFKIASSRKGVAYSLIMGVVSALGCIAFFAAMKSGQALIVAPITSLYPALTVVLAVLFLRERLNKIQMLGFLIAMLSIVILSH